MEKLSVAIADDNEIMLQLLGDIIESDDELNVVGTAKDGEEAYRVIKTKEPDIVLLDIVMPKLDGLGPGSRRPPAPPGTPVPPYHDQCDRTGSYHGRCDQYGGILLHYEAI